MRRTRTIILTLLAGLACLVAATVASAATITAQGTVSAGSTLSAAQNGLAPTFGLTLNGVDQTTSYTLPTTVVDARGFATGGGWNLTITSTQFSDGSGHSFPAAASTITGATTGCGTNSTCTLPTNGISNSSLAVPAGAGPPTAVKFFNAANATGLGTVNVNTSVSVTVPSNVFAGVYSSTVTVSIVAGP